MMRRTTIGVALALYATSLAAQTPTAVHSFTPGRGQATGQQPAYFPANVLGLPDSSARRTVPSVDPHRIVSLGMGGEIVLRFDAPIVDGDGVDFTVFENAFHYMLGSRERLYAEPAEVAVSSDGVSYAAFPFDSLTLDGCAGTMPTNGDRSPFDPAVSGGNGFDLAELGVDSIRFVRIRDVTAIVASDPAHPFWDPTLSGFDLDAVVAIPVEGRSSTASSRAAVAHDAALRLVPNPARDRFRIDAIAAMRRVQVIDALGRVVLTVDPAAAAAPVGVGQLAPGLYVVAAYDADGGRRTALLRIER